MALDRVRRAWFNLIHTQNLVYNTCWEDPRIDREALDIGPSDEILVITSAGCNALDYLLAGASHVHAVDMNPLQNALLELKVAAASTLEYDDFFLLFGRGCAVHWNTLYSTFRDKLSEGSRLIWDRRGEAYFGGKSGKRSFYYHGSSGTFAWLVNGYLNRIARMKGVVNDLLGASSMQEQQTIYRENRIGERLFHPLVRFALRRDTTLAMLGVPRSQRRQLDEQYRGGIDQFIMDRVEEVLTRMPLADNYFWRVYLTGEYTPGCCPEYLREVNYPRLRNVRDRMTVATDSVLGYLKRHSGKINRFVLLDHMDWLHEHHQDSLAQEWNAIVDRSADNCRVLWRSAGFHADFVNQIPIQHGGRRRNVGEFLTYHPELANQLHSKDRVNTYGSFYIADLRQ